MTNQDNIQNNNTNVNLDKISFTPPDLRERVKTLFKFNPPELADRVQTIKKQPTNEKYYRTLRN